MQQIIIRRMEENIESENRDFDSEKNIQSIQNYRIVKSNRLINCKSNFTAMEHRIILLAIVQIKPTDDRLQMYKVYIRQVLGKDNKTKYNVVREAIRRLHQSAIELEEMYGWKSYAFITKAQGKYKENFIEIQFHEDIQQFLLGLKGCYTSYKLKHVLNFRGNYTLRIYELCRQRQPLGFRVFEIEHLKTMLSLEKKKAYLNFGQFKLRVLEPACREINETSDLIVRYKEIKEGKKVVKLRFEIKEKNSHDKGIPIAEGHIGMENIANFEKLGFEEDVYFELKKQYGIDRVTGALALYEKSADKIKDPKAWILAALKNNYIDKEAYQKKFEEKEEKHRKKNKLLWEISGREVEIDELKYKIRNIEKDIEYYKKEGAFKRIDRFRFLEGYTVEYVVEELERERRKCYDEMLEKEREVDDLEVKRSALKRF